MTLSWQQANRTQFAIFCRPHFGHVGLAWQDHVKLDNRFKRPADAHDLLGNPAKAIRQLGWKPSVTFAELIQLMVDEDWKQVMKQ